MKVQRNLKNKPKRIQRGTSLEDVFDYPPKIRCTEFRESRLQLGLLIRLVQHSHKREDVLQKGEGFPATRNETWKVSRSKSGRKRDEREEGNRKRPRRDGFETLLRRKASNVPAMRARFDTSRRVGVNRVKPRHVLTFQFARPLIVIRGLETEIDGFRANKSSRFCD